MSFLQCHRVFKDRQECLPCRRRLTRQRGRGIVQRTKSKEEQHETQVSFDRNAGGGRAADGLQRLRLPAEAFIRTGPTGGHTRCG